MALRTIPRGRNFFRVVLEEPVELLGVLVGGYAGDTALGEAYGSPLSSLAWVKRWRPWCFIFLNP